MNKLYYKLGSILFGMILMISAQGVEAQHAPKHKHRNQHYGKVYHRVTGEGQWIYHHGSHYRHHNGRFYKFHRGNMIQVQAPIGLRVMILPRGCDRIVSGGQVYFLYGDTFYRRTRRGFEVVSAPRIGRPYRSRAYWHRPHRHGNHDHRNRYNHRNRYEDDYYYGYGKGNGNGQGHGHGKGKNPGKGKKRNRHN